MNGSPPQAELEALNGLFDSGRIAEVIERGEKLLARFPESFAVHEMLGTANGMLGRDQQAVECLRKALQLNPDFAIGHVNLAVALGRLGRGQEAATAFAQALQMEPGWAEIQHCLGSTLHSLGRLDEAVAAYERAVGIAPNFSQAWHDLGASLQKMGCMDEAAASFDRALEIEPELASALMLTFYDDPAANRRRAEKYCADTYPAPSGNLIDRRISKSDVIRIGYFSADFHEHAVMHCMARLFELHDRSRFSVQLFSYGDDSDDEMRRRLKHAADAFHEVRSLTDYEVADFARRQRIDIAVDLMGHTSANRLGIFACRAAPIQISYLGYPGTLGTPFIDYIVADRVVIPEAKRQHYSEKIIFLPHSYQVNDDRRSISDRVMTRTELGLPSQGFVFCCFNNTYKISSEEFDIWMRLLDQVEGSVLWLFKANSWAESNLRQEARKRGLEPDRLIFADHMPLPEHLARHAQADLFLDTFNYNGHATASHALWAGLPLVTRTGQGFAARVASSLLTAIGLPELITQTSEEYESLALALARDPDGLSQIRAKLASNRMTEPLFDSMLFTRHIEAAYERAYETCLEGRQPADIVIEQVMG